MKFRIVLSPSCKEIQWQHVYRGLWGNSSLSLCLPLSLFWVDTGRKWLEVLLLLLLDLISKYLHPIAPARFSFV